MPKVFQTADRSESESTNSAQRGGLRPPGHRLRTLGHPVDAAPGVAGGYRLGAGGNLPPLLLDDDEAVAIADATNRRTQWPPDDPEGACGFKRADRRIGAVMSRQSAIGSAASAGPGSITTTCRRPPELAHRISTARRTCAHNRAPNRGHGLGPRHEITALSEPLRLAEVVLPRLQS